MARILVNILMLSVACLMGCQSTPVIEPKKTLASIDTPLANTVTQLSRSTVSEQNEGKIKQAYYQYIRNAQKTDASRKNALNRLAQLELSFTQKLVSQGDDPEISPQYRQSLEKTAHLLETTLADYPDAKGNDQNYYHLARTYDQLDQYEKSDDALKLLIKKYPRSDYFVEAQFRIAERAFAKGNYLDAEDAYTEVILSPIGDRFYEKSLFKRGWTRYKQQLPEEALDDYIQVASKYALTTKNATQSEKNVFDETLRAIALASLLLETQTGFYEYLKTQPEFTLVYESFRATSQLYLKQERYSDSSAILKQFIRYYPEDTNLPFAYIQVIESWKKGGFKEKVIEDVTDFYNKFNPSAVYWQQAARPTPEKVNQALRENIVLIAKTYHEAYQTSRKPQDYQKAKNWYQRYLQHYSSFANQNKLYSAYGSLLIEANENVQALKFFEKSAFNNELILDKTSAYTAISLADKLYAQKSQSDESATYLAKYLNYSKAFVSLYPGDKRSAALALRAAQLSFKDQQYAQALEFTQLPVELTPPQALSMRNIRARAFYELEDYINAEELIKQLLASGKLDKAQRNTFTSSLALAIYKQGEKAESSSSAYGHFSRISRIAPKTDIAATGLFDAIAIVVKEEQWKQAIDDIERFKKLYPNNKNIATVNKSLTVAYLKSNQQGKAAKAFEQLALSDGDKKVKMAALWKAGELYESKNQYKAAIRAYRDLANDFPDPYDENMEAMYKLVGLYELTRETQKRYFWQNKIRRKDANAADETKSERTQFIAANTVLNLAQQKRLEFKKIELTEPLASSLKKKKTAMKQAIDLYGRASSFGMAKITTESTHSIGYIYKQFSQSLLDSERPKNLSEDELEQYEILLDDQAFPFEEKAIEFFEVNVGRSADGTHNKWIAKSFDELKAVFPVRYNRSGKIGFYDEK